MHVAIKSLPLELGYDQAVECAYREELDWIEQKLSAGLSVLVECDKQLSNYIYKALRQRFRQHGGRRLRLLSGAQMPPATEHEGIGATQSTLTQRLMEELREAIFDARTDAIIALTHLDILTTTTRSSLSMDAREAAAIMYENPDLVFLGFTDPEFEIPPVIEKVFAVKTAVAGIARDKLSGLILQKEARKFGVTHFNPFDLYTYVSGLNAVRFRQILSQIESRVDFDPMHPQTAKAIYQDIRKLTLTGDLEVPQVDLERDIGGYEDVKEKLRTEILDLLQIKERSGSSEDVRAIEEIVPKGMIFFGPPGTGKTFFAKAMATALNATVLIVSGPELKSKWVGESEQNLRRIFAQARKSAPSIIVFDELDSFASARGTYSGSGVEHSMVNQLLTEMDGFRKEELVFIVGTTNFPESLDQALLRPGRFELTIEVPYPNRKARRHILEIYIKKFGIDVPSEVLKHMLTRTEGFVDASKGIRFSGDHLYALMRGLKREQLRRGGGQMTVTKEDVDRVLDGKKASKKRVLNERERRTVAIHEAGHAILAYTLPHCPTVERITIASEEEDYLGYVMHAVSENEHVRTRHELLDSICVALGGREAELMVLGDVSSGCWNDLQQATGVAALMVEQLGMNERMGLRSYRQNTQQSAPLVLTTRDISESTARALDEEIQQVLKTQHKRCAAMLTTHRKEFDTLVDLLLQKSTLGIEDMKEIFGGREFKLLPTKRRRRGEEEEE